MDPPITSSYPYMKPFYLYYYNKPKQPPLKPIKAIDFRKKPKIPIRFNTAAKMRNKVIREYASRDKNPFVNYRTLSHATQKKILAEPKYLPKDTKASQFRYKWVREVPVVSCRFTEHVMMYHKPPFTFERPGNRCGQYRLRNMKIKSPERQEPEAGRRGSSGPVIPSILQ